MNPTKDAQVEEVKFSLNKIQSRIWSRIPGNQPSTLNTHHAMNLNSKSCSVFSFQCILIVFVSLIRTIRYVTTVDVNLDFNFMYIRGVLKAPKDKNEKVGE